MYIFFFFFFQAEDGIRDFHVTGVQTCALPISTPSTTTRTPTRSTWCASANRSKLAASTPAPRTSTGPSATSPSTSPRTPPTATPSQRRRSATTSTGSGPSCASRPAPTGAPTGCSTASSRRRPTPSYGPATAKAASTRKPPSASADAASSSPATGPARPSPTTAPTHAPGSEHCSASATSTTRSPSSPRSRAPRPPSPGNWPNQAIPTYHPCNTGSCAPSPPASNNAPNYKQPANGPGRPEMFRQLDATRSRRRRLSHERADRASAPPGRGSSSAPRRRAFAGLRPDPYRAAAVGKDRQPPTRTPCRDRRSNRRSPGRGVVTMSKPDRKSRNTGRKNPRRLGSCGRRCDSFGLDCSLSRFLVQESGDCFVDRGTGYESAAADLYRPQPPDTDQVVGQRTPDAEEPSCFLDPEEPRLGQRAHGSGASSAISSHRVAETSPGDLARSRAAW